jgi:hypothetical protein
MHCMDAFCKEMSSENLNGEWKACFRGFLPKSLEKLKCLEEAEEEYLLNNLQNKIFKSSFCPALKSYCCQRFYLEWLAEKRATCEKVKKIHLDTFFDPFHIISASYCSAFISNDDNLIKQVCKKINPKIEPVKFDDLLVNL